MIHLISSTKGVGFTEGSDFKHCEPYVSSAFSNQKFICEWSCIMTDQALRYFCISMTENSMTKTENLLYFAVPPTDM